VYRVVLEETGEPLQEFREADFAKGQAGAQMAAARVAVREGKLRPVLLEGPEGFATRRYAPEWKDDKWRPYRVRCSTEGCARWVHPVSSNQARGGTLCREHFRASPETRERLARLNEERHRKE